MQERKLYWKSCGIAAEDRGVVAARWNEPVVLVVPLLETVQVRAVGFVVILGGVKRLGPRFRALDAIVCFEANARMPLAQLR